ncbi:N-6 DNA methylase [Magnetospirillum sp. SS-4]|uniref:N-6 DNA methylase n=1 Tax=Magnetospirillum sp. SS-4 TaxID=2681465 RepID=UPI00138168DE|nr:N-6 DNA methylase [Magnetospirillum sp. SS-4]CAA7627615.1 putative Type I restriction enzyme (Modification subunit) [Magnetospirillum sp. SS-4]
MLDKAIFQICDSLRTSLTMPDAFRLSLQILAWAKLSSTKRLPEPLCLSARMLEESGRAIDVLMRLGQEGELMGPAFSGAQQLGELSAASLRPTLELALRMTEAGVLVDLDASDAIVIAEPWTTGGFALPAELADLMIGLADPCAGESAYTPWDHGGQLATRVARRDAQAYLETPQPPTIAALISLLADKPFHVSKGDPISSPSAIEGGKPIQFDCAIAFPPLGQRYELDVVDRDWFDRFPERTQSVAVLATRHLLCQARRRVVLAAPNSLLFSPGSEFALRQDLVRRGIVQAVIALPGGLLNMTSIPLAILVLDPAGGHEQIKFINADTPRFREPISKARSRICNVGALVEAVLTSAMSADSAIVPISDVLANDAQLQVGRYVLPDIKKHLQTLLTREHTVLLGDVASTYRPMQTTSVEDDAVDVFEVGAADLPSFGYITRPGRTVKVEATTASKNAQQFLRPLDIVLIIKGSVGKVGIVPPDAPPPGPGGWVVGQSATILRVAKDSVVTAPALAVQLRSSIGQELLSGIVSGASIQLIRLSELMRLPILVPDHTMAQKATEALAQEAKLQQEIDTLRAEQSQLASDLWSVAGLL